MCGLRWPASYDEPMGDEQELVHYEVADRVAMITLDSQHNRNALSRQLVGELFAHLEAAAADDEVLVVLVQAAGRKARRRGLVAGGDEDPGPGP